jgi:GrpB-like predicted nucleotidyltransferase (UPF0157 family)
MPDIDAFDEARLLAVTIGEPTRVDGQVVLVDYDPAWPAQYERQAARVRAALGERVLLLEHAGSTSVPGLAAKPIIDMILGVADPADEPGYVPDLQAARYVLRISEPDFHEHRMFDDTDPLVQVHVFAADSPEITRMLAFRDRLRTRDDERLRYEMAKRELAARHWTYVQEYADAKGEVVEGIIARALTDRDAPAR